MGRGEHHSYIVTKDFTGEGSTLNPNDSFYAELTRSDDRKTFCTCRFKPEYIDKVNEPVFRDDINLAPRRGDSRQLQVLTNTSGTYTIYNLTGYAVQTGMFGNEYGSPDITIDPSVTRGTYLIAFRSNDGMQTTKKWIVE